MYFIQIRENDSDTIYALVNGIIPKNKLDFSWIKNQQIRLLLEKPLSFSMFSCVDDPAITKFIFSLVPIKLIVCKCLLLKSYNSFFIMPFVTLEHN